MWVPGQHAEIGTSWSATHGKLTTNKLEQNDPPTVFSFEPYLRRFAHPVISVYGVDTTVWIRYEVAWPS